MPVAPPRPSVCTCTTLGLTRSKMPVRAAENASGSGNDDFGVKSVVCVMFMYTCSLLALPNCHLKRLQGIPTHNFYGNGFAYASADQEQLQFLSIVDLMAVERDQNITKEHTTLLSRAVLIDFDNEQAMFLIASSTLRGWKFDKLATDAQIAALDIPLFCQSISDARGNMNRYC